MVLGTAATSEIPLDWNLESLQPARQTLAILRKPITIAAGALDFKVRLVGGWVRDLLLASMDPQADVSFLSVDLDLVVEGDARKLGKLLRENWGGSLKVHDPFLTATWQFPSETFGGETSLSKTGSLEVSIDLITARSEVYPQPGHLPFVAAGTFEQDMARRDITINTCSLDLTDWPSAESSLVNLKVSCWSEALEDLGKGHIRLLHAGSLHDDPTRILRLARYEQRMGFQIEPSTEEWLNTAMKAGVLATVTPERIKAGIEQALAEERPAKVLRRLQDWGVLDFLGLIPDPDRFWPALEKLAERPGRDQEVNWILLLGLNLAPSASERRALPKFSVSMERNIGAYKQLVNEKWNELRPGQVWMKLKQISNPVRVALWASLPACRCTLSLFESKWRHVTSHLDGNDLLSLGYSRGPQIGHMLAQLRCRAIEGELQTREQELEAVQHFLGPPPGTHGISN